MKYIQIFAYAAVTLMAIGCQPKATDATVDEQPATEVDASLPTYKIATINTYPPFATADENGSITGFDIDIIRAIGEVEKFNPEFITTPWDKWETDLSQDKVDIWAAGITIKEERKKVATYSNSYMNYETMILTLDTPEYTNLNEKTLNKYLVGAEANSTSFDIATSLQPNPSKALSFISNFSAFEGLIQNKVNAVVGNNLVLSNITTSYPDFKYKFLPLSQAITNKKELGFMVKKDRTELSEKINSGLKTIQEDGTYDDIKIKWFGDL